MRINELVSKIRDTLQSNELLSSKNYVNDSLIFYEINKGQEDILIKTYPIRDKLQILTQPDVRSYDLPDYVGKITSVYSDYKLEPAGASERLIYNTNKGSPLFYYVLSNKKIELYPTPDAEYSINIEFYYQKPPIKASTTQELFLPDSFDDSIEFYVYYKIFASIGEYDASARYYQLYQNSLALTSGHVNNLMENPKPIGDW